MDADYVNSTSMTNKRRYLFVFAESEKNLTSAYVNRMSHCAVKGQDSPATLADFVKRVQSPPRVGIPCSRGVTSFRLPLLGDVHLCKLRERDTSETLVQKEGRRCRPAVPDCVSSTSSTWLLEQICQTFVRALTQPDANRK